MVALLLLGKLNEVNEKINEHGYSYGILNSIFKILRFVYFIYSQPVLLLVLSITIIFWLHLIKFVFLDKMLEILHLSSLWVGVISKLLSFCTLDWFC
jgi:hypothetical protein